ncbi:MAG: hypothetical protein GY899_14050 [Verrucomicrobiaceae bacterium]|nr:hypothetical protein [Verrucomicrobiaceae bacterium]
MDNQLKVCHDLKTDRPDIGQPLPRILTLLPILFVLSVIGAIALNALFFFQLRNAEKAKEEWKLKVATESSKQKEIVAKIETIKDEERRANDVQAWVEGSRQMQPLAVAIARSMDVKSSIAELSLFREAENPNQIKLGFKFDNGGQKQLDATLEAVNGLGYRSYSANQTAGKEGSLDYQATLIWQKSNKEALNLTATDE